MKIAVSITVLMLAVGIYSLSAVDFSGDGTDDIAIFRPSTGYWAIKGLTRVYFGKPNDIPVPADYNGSGRANIAIFRPSHGYWAVRHVTRCNFGQPDDIPIGPVGGPSVGRMVMTLGGNGKRNAYLGFINNSYPNHGSLMLCDSAGNIKVNMAAHPTWDSGIIQTNGPNGKANAAMNWLAQNANHGAVTVFNSAGVQKAGIQVMADGRGICWGDTKNFRMANPDQEGTDIWYCSLEGPEAGAYYRGTGRLVNGAAVIRFPGHFITVASGGITVQVTPLSAKSRGLAVVEKNNRGMTVRELDGGRGSYEFDYLVMGVRRGYEDYEVIRPTEKARTAFPQID